MIGFFSICSPTEVKAFPTCINNGVLVVVYVPTKPWLSSCLSEASPPARSCSCLTSAAGAWEILADVLLALSCTTYHLRARLHFHRTLHTTQHRTTYNATPQEPQTLINPRQKRCDIPPSAPGATTSRNEQWHPTPTSPSRPPSSPTSRPPSPRRLPSVPTAARRRNSGPSSPKQTSCRPRTAPRAFASPTAPKLLWVLRRRLRGVGEQMS